MKKILMILVSFFFIISCDQNTSKNNSESSKGTNTGRDYIPLVSKGISENGIWGTRCYYSNGKVLEIESPRSVQIQGGWPPKCPSKY
tara:strand:+ start:196 stop:456 length:261 start_codon:yes stop_codon:yes gene_type:complete